MSVLPRGLVFLVLAGILVLTADTAQAQPAASPSGVAPMPVGNPGTQMGALSNPYLGGGSYPSIGGLSNGGYGGGGGYGYFPPYYNPWMMPYLSPSASYLFGAASITQANAQYMLTLQQARLQAAYANQAKIDVRRRLFDQLAYERAYFLANFSPEVVRKREMDIALSEARNKPPQVKILSADSLNSLLAHLIEQQGKGQRGPRVDLPEDILKRINVSNGTGANIGLLKDGAKLEWPLALQQAELREVEKRLADNIALAVKEVKFNNPLGRGLGTDIAEDLGKLTRDVDNMCANGSMGSSQYVEARRYLNQLNTAVKALTDPHAVNFFNDTWKAKGSTVAELVKNMDESGLRFAPATRGDEAAYRALHSKLVSYDANITTTASGN